MRPLLLTVVLVAAGLLGFAWGYAASERGLFPGKAIEVLLQSRAPVESASAEPPEHDAAWREKASFYTAFAAPAAVVMIGDSITAGAEWAEMFPGAGIVNRGIDSDTIRGVLQRMDGILSVHAKKAFVMLGINDIIAGRSEDEVFSDYEKIVEKLGRSGARVLVQSTLLCNRKLATAYSCSENSARIMRLNSRLAQLASKNVAFVDLNASLADAGGLKAELTYDGVHLNGLGYRVWKGVIAGHMQPD